MNTDRYIITKEHYENPETVIFLLAIIASPIENFLRVLFELIGFHLVDDALIYCDVTIYVFVVAYVFTTQCLIRIREVRNDFIITIIIICLFSLVYVISYFITPEIEDVTNHPVINFAIKYSLFFFLGIHIRREDILIKTARAYVYFSFLYSIVAIIYCMNNNYGGIAMMSSYDISFGGMVGFAIYLVEKNRLFGFLSIVIATVSFLLGSRGAFFILLLSYIWIYYILNRRKTVKQVIIFIVLIVIVLLLIANMNTILNFIGKQHADARMISQLLGGTLFDSSGRYQLINHSINTVIDDPLRFRGIYADRVVLSKYFGGTNNAGYWIDSGITNLYVHNIVIEILVQFGLPIGLIICALIFYNVVYYFKTIMRNNDVMVPIWGGLMAFRGLFQLFVSSSYLESLWFWLFLGTMIRINSFKPSRIEKYHE